MTVWTDKRTRDVSIRAAGAFCCISAYLAAGELANLRPSTPGTQPAAIAYLLAAIAFLGASLGTALAVLGHHVFDEIEVSDRWKRRPPARDVASVGVDANAYMAVGRPASANHGLPTPTASAIASELPLPWRDFGSIAATSNDLRVANQW